MRVVTACDEGVASLLNCGDTVKCLVTKKCTYYALPICGVLALTLKEKKKCIQILMIIISRAPETN